MLADQRKWLNKHPQAVIAGSLALLLAAAAFAVIRKQRFVPMEPALAWYYDTVAQEVFIDEAGLIPPYFRSNGNESVRAHPFSCGGCAPGTMFIGYFEKYNAEMKAKLQLAYDPNRLGTLPELMHGRLLSTDGTSWFDAFSEQGRQITSVLPQRCPPKTLIYCGPTDDQGRARSMRNAEPPSASDPGTALPQPNAAPTQPDPSALQ